MMKKICLIVLSFSGFWMMAGLLIGAYNTIVFKLPFWDEATRGIVDSFFMTVLGLVILDCCLKMEKDKKDKGK